MLEEILDIRNVAKAFKQVTSNKGAGGVDGMQTDELRDYLNTHWPTLRKSILEGSYHPSSVRKVEIPKNGGGTRMLGIPTVIDRLLQQSISQWLNPKYESKFSENSFGFRKGRNAHQAVMQAKKFLNEGKTWIVELDMERFFDCVNHDKLMGLLTKSISDRQTLKLIRSYLNSDIMECGVLSPRREGTPQGSSLSPLLSNIILNELDKELHKRNHSFVRYADDCSIYVKSEKSAKRTLESITKYIEEKLKLKVNREKTKISRPVKSSLLGFSFYKSEKGWEIRISSKSLKKMKEKLKTKTKRNDPTPVKKKIDNMEALVRGWINYFAIAQCKSKMEELDELVRVRLRIGLWKQWKKSRTRINNLLKLGTSKSHGYMWGHSSLGYCRLAHSPILQTTLNNEYFRKLGYVGFTTYYFWKTKHQKKLF